MSVIIMYVCIYVLINQTIGQFPLGRKKDDYMLKREYSNKVFHSQLITIETNTLPAFVIRYAVLCIIKYALLM